MNNGIPSLLITLPCGALAFLVIWPKSQDMEKWRRTARKIAAWFSFIAFAGPFLLIRTEGFAVYLMFSLFWAFVLSGGAYGLVRLWGKVVDNKEQIVRPITAAGQAIADRAKDALPQPMRSSTELSDEFFAQVADELDANVKDAGLWTKAFVMAEGDEVKQKVEYIRLRTAQIAEEQREQSEKAAQRERDQEQLIEVDREINVNGDTCLIDAARNGSYELVLSLLREGADASLENIWGLTARQIALKEEHNKLAYLLADHELRQSVDQKPQELFEAARSGDLAKVEQELRRGIYPYSTGIWGKTARQLANEHGHKAVSKVLEDAEKEWDEMLARLSEEP